MSISTTADLPGRADAGRACRSARVSLGAYLRVGSGPRDSERARLDLAPRRSAPVPVVHVRKRFRPDAQGGRPPVSRIGSRAPSPGARACCTRTSSAQHGVRARAGRDRNGDPLPPDDQARARVIGCLGACRVVVRRSVRPAVHRSTANALTGAPGAVVIYALIALVVWPNRRPWRPARRTAARGSPGRCCGF